MDNNLRVLRRLHAVDGLVKYKLDKYVPFVMSSICDENENYFYAVVSRWVIEEMYYGYFSDIDDSSDEWGEIYRIIAKYIDSVHKKEIFDFFNNRCGK